MLPGVRLWGESQFSLLEAHDALGRLPRRSRGGARG